MKKIRCVILRGGTSKGVYLREEDLPTNAEERKKTILRIFGSPDKRQIDGLGGADALTSKMAIIGKSEMPDCDVDYLFGQVSIDEPSIHTRGICGNITSGVGPFAVDEGLVEAVEPFTTVRIFNRNTNKRIIATVPVKDGRAMTEGDYAIAGVPGTGARITLDFSDASGAITGKLLPTGHTIDQLQVKGVGTIPVSIVDCCQVQVFVRPEDVGMTGRETPFEIDADAALLNRLEQVRGTAAAMLGFCSSPEEARHVTANSPHLVIARKAEDYCSYLDQTPVRAEEIDLMARMMFMQKTHKTYAGTGSMCTAVASLIDGTLIHEVCRPEAEKAGCVRIGHPAGVIEVEAAVEQENGISVVKKVGISRTARRIMDGFVYI